MTKRIIVLTGAGISAESGVSTFRDPEGVWAKYDYQQVATPEGFAANPTLVHEFYNARRGSLDAVEPNPAHIALAHLEKELSAHGGHLTLVTQNVDDLHERGGAKHVIHMHGELKKARCDATSAPSCGAVFDWHDDLRVDAQCPVCGATGSLRPHIVWFGEMPMHMDEIEVALSKADLFASIGTSGSVYPAAGYVHAARGLGIPCIELNLEPSENAAAFNDAHYGKAGDIVPLWVDELLSELD